jgi:glycine cleavage system aminomethyltransferase T
MAYLQTAQAVIGTEVMISIREKLHPGRVVKKPFV